ncbi:hypothetical protein [Demequina sp. SO4-18]|uniref:hypothetical protein n=1 Tax=Demequina sp. SO4-18 TaxID=3401026 RepID=UPI003B58C999
MSARDYGRFDPPDESETLDALMDGVDCTEAIVGVSAHEIDAAHAVALERNLMANWLDSFSDHTDDDEYHQLAEFVRQGAHNPQTPTSGDSRGLSRDEAQNPSAHTSTDTSGPEAADSDEPYDHHLFAGPHEGCACWACGLKRQSAAAVSRALDDVMDTERMRKAAQTAETGMDSCRPSPESEDA